MERKLRTLATLSANHFSAQLDAVVLRTGRHTERIRIEHPQAAAVLLERDDSEAKIWLDPVRLGRSGGFTGKELRRLEQITAENHQQLMDSWNDFFNG